MAFLFLPTRRNEVNDMTTSCCNQTKSHILHSKTHKDFYFQKRK